MKVKASFAVVLSAVLIMLIASLAAQSQKKPNETPALGQITGGDSSIACPGPSGTYGNTDLTLTLPTTGKPVLVTFHANATLSTNTGINMRTTIDGSAVDA